MPIIIFGIVLVLSVIAIIIDNKTKKIVLGNSKRIKTLLDLNQTIHFKNVQPKYSNRISCDSKRKFDHLSLDNFLMSLINSNETLYRNIVETISYNREEYKHYILRVETIQSEATADYCKALNLGLTKFLQYEDRIFKKKILRKPQCEVMVYCKATYTSPRGKNHYWKEERFNYTELKNLLDEVMELKAQQETRQYQIKLERAKMTDSLRYDILKRDNFRCQICGSTARDGVKLHVDHIVPVSKGGKTVPSNLQTLCDRCNLGKSNKI